MPSFTPAASGSRLYLLAGGDGSVGFWPNASTDAASISLAASWTTQPGCYVYFATVPGDMEAMASALAALMVTPSLAGARFLWLDNSAGGEASTWSFLPLFLDQASGALQATVTQGIRCGFGSYALTVASGVILALNATADGFDLHGDGANPLSFGFSAYNRIWPLSALSNGDGLSFTGNLIGCWQLAWSLPATGNADFFDAIDLGFRYSVQDDLDPDSLASLRHPLFPSLNADLAFSLAFDPLRPLIASRTYFAFSSATPGLPSCFRTNFGEGVTLQPATSPATSLPSGFGFGFYPTTANANAPTGNGYTVPIGAYSATTSSTQGSHAASDTAPFLPPVDRLMGGLAGIEYFGLPAGGAMMVCLPGQSAYALPGTETPLQGPATTSYVAIVPKGASALTYFAQPEQSAFYQAANAGYLDFMEVPAGSIAQAAAPLSASAYFPMAPYAGVSSGQFSAARSLELSVLSPARRAALAQAAPPPTGTPSVAQVVGATPQGLVVEFNDARNVWNTVRLARPPDVGAGNAANPWDLQWLQVTGGLRSALQSNQLFLVATDPAQLEACADFEYMLTAGAIADLAAAPVPVPETVLNQLTVLIGQAFSTEAAFQTQLQNTLSAAEYQQYGAEITQYAVYFELDVAGWRFRLAPSFWAANDPELKTMMLVKYAHRSIEELSLDPGAWNWPDAANPQAETQARLRRFIAAARSSLAADPKGESSDYAYFVNQVIDDPAWNGIVFLNADVPLTALPSQLAGLAAGIDAAKFRAHHVGVSITPITNETGTVTLGTSSIFGLIAYQDTVDLVYSGMPYDFKVLTLQVLFANCAIRDFAASIELMANKLFGEAGNLVASEHANNLIMIGSYQHGVATAGGAATDSYYFIMANTQTFAMQSKILTTVSIDRAEFTTLVGTGSEGQVVSRFLLSGRLRFQALTGFDAFSFGPETGVDGQLTGEGCLTFTGLSVFMSFESSAPTNRVFHFDASGLQPNVTASLARPQSLYNHFPLNLASFSAGETMSPADKGFNGITSPLSSGPLGAEWYGLVYTLDLGTFGALAGNAGFTVEILTAWSPSSSRATVYLGLRLPGAHSLGSLLPIQGVLQLGFQAMEFTANVAANRADYVLKFRHFGIKLLSLSFPPGEADIFIFGNPSTEGSNADGDRTALAWYAAYQADKEGD